MLYEAAQILLMRSTQRSWLKAWAMQVARRRGMKKAIVALARRLAVVMHRSGLTAPNSVGPGKKLPQHDNAKPNPIGCPLGPAISLSQGRQKDCSASSSNPMLEGPGADSEEKREPVSDIDV